MRKSGIKIGTRIRKYRLIKGYSQENMADILSISQKTYSNMENNKSSINTKTLKALAKELDVDIMELLSDDKIVVQHNNSSDSSTFQGGIIVNNSKELVIQLKERIKDLKNNLKDKDNTILLLKKRIAFLENKK